MDRRKGFTLIELLVVISIIALLLSILMPALQKVKEQGRKIVCGNNLKTLAMANMLYATRNDGNYVAQNGSSGWRGNEEFLDDIAMATKGWAIESDGHRCPSDKRRGKDSDEGFVMHHHSYGYNHTPFWGGYIPPNPHPKFFTYTYKVSRISQPASKIMFMCSQQFAVTWGDPAIHWDIYGDATHDIFSSGTPAYRHNEKTNTAFFDGHVGTNEKDELWFTPYSRKKLERIWLPDITIK